MDAVLEDVILPVYVDQGPHISQRKEAETDEGGTLGSSRDGILAHSDPALRASAGRVARASVPARDVLTRACLQLSRMIAQAGWTAPRKFLASLS